MKVFGITRCRIFEMTTCMDGSIVWSMGSNDPMDSMELSLKVILSWLCDLMKCSTCLIFGLKERLVARGRRSAVRLKENTHTEAKTASFWPSIFFLNELTKTIFLPDPSLSTPTHTLPPHPPNTKTFNPHLLHCRPAKNKKLNFYTMTLWGKIHGSVTEYM